MKRPSLQPLKFSYQTRRGCLQIQWGSQDLRNPTLRLVVFRESVIPLPISLSVLARLDSEITAKVRKALSVLSPPFMIKTEELKSFLRTAQLKGRQIILEELAKAWDGKVLSSEITDAWGHLLISNVMER